MPNNPYDDFLKNIARMVEDMVRNMPDTEGARFIGYTIIAGNQGEDSQIIHIGKAPNEEIEYEVIEDEDYLFITGSLPPDRGSPRMQISQPTRSPSSSGKDVPRYLSIQKSMSSTAITRSGTGLSISS